MIQNLIASNGGLVATILISVAVLNVCLSCLSKILALVHKTVPSWVQPLTSFLQGVTNVLSANTTNPAKTAAMLEQAPPKSS